MNVRIVPMVRDRAFERACDNAPALLRIEPRPKGGWRMVSVETGEVLKEATANGPTVYRNRAELDRLIAKREAAVENYRIP